MLISVLVLTIVTLTPFQGPVDAQVLPGYYGYPAAPVNNEEDDIGLLLAMLLLAGRNRGGGCGGCGCCNCCGGNGPRNIPIPIPIPVPITTSIVNKGCHNAEYDEDDYEDKP